MIKQIFSWKMLIVLAMGFASGLPLALTGSTLKAWLSTTGVSLTTIGFFSFVGLPYTLKFMWAPLADRFTIPFFGRRRGWILMSQAGLMIAFIALGSADPATSLQYVAVCAVIVAFLSATQDIVIDAYRREILEDNELGLGSSMAINGYRIAMLVSGGAAIALSDQISWHAVYAIMAGCLAVSSIVVILSPEPKVNRMPRKFSEAVIEPFKDFFLRDGAWVILAFILLYKAGDAMASEMTMPYYLKGVGFSKTQVGLIVKTVGMWCSILGAFIGGVAILRIGIYRALWIFGIIQAITILGFPILLRTGPDSSWLSLIIALETLTAGMGTSAYVAYMASLTNKRFTATQYALFTSLMGVPRTIFGPIGGSVADHFGWDAFFILCAACAIPGLFLLLKVAPWNERHDGMATVTAKTA